MSAPDAGRRLGRKAAAEAYQRDFHIVKQTGPGAVAGVLAGDEDIVDARESQKGQKEPHCLAQAAAGPVADHGSADLAGGGKARPGGGTRLGPAAGLDDQELAAFGDAIRDIKEFAARAQALDRRAGRLDLSGRGRSGTRSGAEALAALGAAARSTFWPFLVAMRERKPWRRLRLRLLGWKVRLVDTGHAPCSFTKGGELARSAPAKSSKPPGLRKMPGCPDGLSRRATCKPQVRAALFL